MKFILSMVLLIIATGPALATVRYSGEQTLWQDTVWEGEVRVDGILTVAPEVTLEIRPGTKVLFSRRDTNRDGIGESELFIQGTFLAIGTAGNPIVFTSAEAEPLPGDWGAINMMASMTENRLEHCRVEYGYRGFHAHFATARLEHSSFRYNRRGAQFQESTVSIVDCRFENNFNGLQFRDSTVTLAGTRISGGYWGLRCVYSSLAMRGCRVSGNLVNGVSVRDSEIEIRDCDIDDNRRGLYLQRTDAKVSGNTIRLNNEHGIFLEDSKGMITGNSIERNGRSGIRVINSPVRMTSNRIVANDEYALINDGDQDLALQGNWWGTVDPAEIERLIRDQADRSGVGRVSFIAAGSMPARTGER